MAPETVVITGATGLVGQALLEALETDVVALTHSGELADAPGRTVLRADVSEPFYGLGEQAFEELARRADAVVHCAALTDYAATYETAAKVNVEGVKHTLELASRAQVPLYHLSTAFVVTPTPPGDDQRIGPQTYLKTKRAGEELVRSSGLDAMIIRPSVVVGDSETGRCARFQGIHVLIQFLFQGTLAILPMHRDAHIDLIAQDQVAVAIAQLVADGARGGLCWLTAGDRALTAQRLLELAIEEAQARGVRVDAPRLVDPEIVDRLFRPALLPDFPPRIRRRFEQLLELIAVFFTDNVFPSSFDQLREEHAVDLGVDQEQAFRNTVRYWADAKGYGATASSGGKA